MDDVIVSGPRKWTFRPSRMDVAIANLDKSKDFTDPFGARPLFRVCDVQGPDTWSRVAAASLVRQCADGPPVERRGESVAAAPAA